MTRIVSRQSFMDGLQNKELDVRKLTSDAQVKSAITAAGGNVSELARADLNGDGKISDEREKSALFKALDKFDRDGNAATFVATDRGGATTTQGKIFDRLGMLAENRTGGVAPTPARTPTLGEKLAAAGEQSIASKMKGHSDAIDKTGIGLFYGDHSSFKSMSTADKKQYIEENKKPGTRPAMPRESSCIGWALDNVGAAYKAAGREERWNEIKANVVAKGSKGMDLAKELKQDGWQAIYWNPDAKHPDDGNPEHSVSAANVARGRSYYGIIPDDQVINYRPTAGQGTRQDMSGIEKLREVPFFFGLAKGGVHTFVGRKGETNEFHWDQPPESKHSIEQKPLENFMWNSGLIMVPPGTWPRS